MRSAKQQVDQGAANTDDGLVARTLAGDIASFELIMRRHNQRLYRLVRSVLRNDADSEDALQDAYLKAFEKLHHYRGPGGFAAWIGRIAINAALDRARQRGKVISFDEIVNGMAETRVQRSLKEALMSRAPTPERLASSADLRIMIERAIEELPDSLRIVFVLRSIEQMSVSETAGQVGVSEEVVRTRHHRARQAVRERLGDRLETLLPETYPFAGARCDRIVAHVLRRLGASPPDTAS